MTNQDDQNKKPASPHISDMILGSLKPRIGKDTNRWIAGLADEAVKEEVEAAAREQAAVATSAPTPTNPPKHSMAEILDHVFDCFQQYEYDFNRSVAGTELVVSIDRPQWHQETVKIMFQPPENIQVFKGKLSTRQWTLLVRGRNEIIEGWFMPIDKILSFSGDPSSFIRFLAIEPVDRNGQTIWTIDGAELEWEHIRDVAKQLFGLLVKVAKGEASPADAFLLRPKAAIDKSHDRLKAIMVEPVSPENAVNDFNEHNPAFTGSFKVGEIAAEAQHQTQQQQNPQHQPQPKIQSLRAREGMQTGPMQVPVSQQPPPQQPPASPVQQHTVQQPMTQPTASYESQPVAPPLSAMQHEVPLVAPAVAAMPPQAMPNPAMPPQTAARPPVELTVENIIEMLNVSIARETDRLAQLGAEAFSRQDLAAVEQTMKRTAKMHEVQAEIKQKVEEWKSKVNQILRD